MRTDHLDPAEREVADEEDRDLAALLSDYLTQADGPVTPRRRDLLARAAALSPTGRRRLRALIGLLAAITTNPSPTKEPRDA